MRNPSASILNRFSKARIGEVFMTINPNDDNLQAIKIVKSGNGLTLHGLELRSSTAPMLTYDQPFRLTAGNRFLRMEPSPPIIHLTTIDGRGGWDQLAFDIGSWFFDVFRNGWTPSALYPYSWRTTCVNSPLGMQYIEIERESVNRFRLIKLAHRFGALSHRTVENRAAMAGVGSGLKAFVHLDLCGHDVTATVSSVNEKVCTDVIMSLISRIDTMAVSDGFALPESLERAPTNADLLGAAQALSLPSCGQLFL